MNTQITCENCGGGFDQNLPYCPYCGTMSYIGAEKQYLEKLDGVREDLDDVRHQPHQVVRQEAIRQGGNVKAVFIGTAVLVVMLAVVYWGYMSLTNMGFERSEDDIRAQMIWDRENFPQLDEWYQAGDYDALAQFQLNLYDENSEYTLYNWEHRDFLGEYMAYRSFCGTVDRWNGGEEITGYEIGTMLIAATTGEMELTMSYMELSEEEQVLCLGYIQEQIAFLKDEIGYTQQQLDEIQSQTVKDKNKWDIQICYDAGDEKERELYD